MLIIFIWIRNFSILIIAIYKIKLVINLYFLNFNFFAFNLLFIDHTDFCLFIYASNFSVFFAAYVFVYPILNINLLLFNWNLRIILSKWSLEWLHRFIYIEFIFLKRLNFFIINKIFNFLIYWIIFKNFILPFRIIFNDFFFYYSIFSNICRYILILILF
jgi:hypothetical protein